MLTSDSKTKKLFQDIEALMDSLSLKTVEVASMDQKNSKSMRVVLAREGEEITTDDLEQAYNIIYPRYEILSGDRDLTLEVSSPGMQRNFKDTLEFEVFKGKTVRVYSVKNSCYVTGRILSSDDKAVVLGNYLIEDKKETGESISIEFSDIAKAKLECKWEEKND
ncbi:MAG: ribosome assembly cofactor RimP [Spirochaetales bacterium]|nr:ribosome assembly cofactor RimP [Candidatus Physcosoma equi]